MTVIRRLSSFFSSPAAVEGGTPEQAAARAFAHWAGLKSAGGSLTSFDFLPAVDAALERHGGNDQFPEQLAADAASYLGELFRQRWGGSWREDPVFGYIVTGFGGNQSARFMPLALFEKKWRSRGKFSLAAFFGALDKRIEAEKERVVPAVEGGIDGLLASLHGATDDTATAKAQHAASEFTAFWRARFGVTLPMTLTGVREVDGFLRSHYYISYLDDRRLAACGFYLGEVARGLFDGNWDFANLPRIDRAALRFPELDYYPVGRIFKMMTEHPDGEPLDEYIRLIPSARSELRKQQPSK